MPTQKSLKQTVVIRRVYIIFWLPIENNQIFDEVKPVIFVIRGKYLINESRKCNLSFCFGILRIKD